MYSYAAVLINVLKFRTPATKEVQTTVQTQIRLSEAVWSGGSSLCTIPTCIYWIPVLITNRKRKLFEILEHLSEFFISWITNPPTEFSGKEKKIIYKIIILFYLPTLNIICFVEKNNVSHDLWKPALMTFRTFYVKIIWKTPKIKKIDMYIDCLKTNSSR